MTCRCRDTLSKPCRWEHPSNSWNKNQKAKTKANRKAQRHDPRKEAKTSR
jgi:hypothetical protein